MFGLRNCVARSLLVIMAEFDGCSSGGGRKNTPNVLRPDPRYSRQHFDNSLEFGRYTSLALFSFSALNIPLCPYTTFHSHSGYSIIQFNFPENHSEASIHSKFISCCCACAFSSSPASPISHILCAKHNFIDILLGDRFNWLAIFRAYWDSTLHFLFSSFSISHCSTVNRSFQCFRLPKMWSDRFCGCIK